jgi:hypothetical protein
MKTGRIDIAERCFRGGKSALRGNQSLADQKQAVVEQHVPSCRLFLRNCDRLFRVSDSFASGWLRQTEICHEQGACHFDA